MNRKLSISCLMTALAVAGIAGEVDLRTARIKVTDPAFSMAQKPQKTTV